MAGVGRIACLAASLALGAAMACAGESARGVDPERDAAARLTGTSAGAVGSRIVLDSLTAAGEELYRAGEYDSARTRLQTALEAASSLGDSAAVARLLTSLGLAAWRLGEYPDARRLGTTALAIKHRHRLRADLFRSYNALGLLARSEGAFEASQPWFDSALAMPCSRASLAGGGSSSSMAGSTRTDPPVI